jgi:hypothetical protein
MKRGAHLALLLGLASCSREARPEAPPESARTLVLCPAASHFVPGVGCVGEPAVVVDAGAAPVASDTPPATDVDAAPIRGTSGNATLFLVTPGARVSLVSGTDRRDVPMMPIRIVFDASRVWTLEATKPGYADYRQEIRFDDGVTEKTYRIELKRLPRP